MCAVTLPIFMSTVRQEVGNLLRAGAILHPVMDEDAHFRYGRVCAAQFVDLALRRHLWFSYGGTHVGPRGLQVTRHPDPLDSPDPDEQLLLNVVFEGTGTTSIVRPRPLEWWNSPAKQASEGLKADGLGMLRRRRYRVLRLLRDLRTDMRLIARSGEQSWDTAPDVFRAGCSFAVLFNIDTVFPHWPMPPEEELFVPSMLSTAFNLALDIAT